MVASAVQRAQLVSMLSRHACADMPAVLLCVVQVLHDIGEKHGVSPSCVASRWVLQQPGVSAVILGARNTTHLRVGFQLHSHTQHTQLVFAILVFCLLHTVPGCQLQAADQPVESWLSHRTDCFGEAAASMRRADRRSNMLTSCC